MNLSLQNYVSGKATSFIILMDNLNYSVTTHFLKLFSVIFSFSNTHMHISFLIVPLMPLVVVVVISERTSGYKVFQDTGERKCVCVSVCVCLRRAGIGGGVGAMCWQWPC